MTVGVMLFTYNRPQYAEKTIRALLDNLSTSDELLVHIADDGSDESQVDELLRLAGGYAGVKAVSWTDSKRRGYGASYNLATQHLHWVCDVLLPLEDDWELLQPLNLDPLLADLRHGTIDCIRMGYLGWTQELSGRLDRGPSGQPYLIFDPASAEPHIFAGHPRLETREFERKVGPWPESFNAGATEFAVSQRTGARAGVAWPMDLVHPRGDLFAHIGAIQAREDQR